MRVCGGEGDRRAAGERRLEASPKSALASATMERPSGVSSARLASRAASARSGLRHARHRQELGRHAVAEGDGAGLVEQQRIDVARRLDGAAGGGDDVEADQPVHAGNADGREQPADGGRDQRDEQRREHGHTDRSVPE